MPAKKVMGLPISGCNDDGDYGEGRIKNVGGGGKTDCVALQLSSKASAKQLE